MKLFLAFALIPVIEIAILIKAGSVIGVVNTIVIVLLTAFVGAYLARMEGLETMNRLRMSMNEGRMPAEELMDAFIIFAAGAVLLTPGFLTDIFGLLLLFPPSRNAFKRWLRVKFDQWTKSGKIHIHRM